jgi:hypothetical protein
VRQDQAFGSTEGRANEGRRGAEPRRAKRKTAWGREKMTSQKVTDAANEVWWAFARGMG